MRRRVREMDGKDIRQHPKLVTNNNNNNNNNQIIIEMEI